jgi:hypothetical protein
MRAPSEWRGDRGRRTRDFLHPTDGAVQLRVERGHIADQKADVARRRRDGRRGGSARYRWVDVEEEEEVRGRGVGCKDIVCDLSRNTPTFAAKGGERVGKLGKEDLGRLVD